MRNYALSLIIHVAGIVMLAVGGAFAVTQNLWFCATACGTIIIGICISLYRPLPHTEPANRHDAANRGMYEE